MKKDSKKRIYLIEQSEKLRNFLEKTLCDMDFCGDIRTASDIETGKEEILRDPPDIVLLDIDLPRLEGMEFLRWQIKQNPIPVIALSSLTQKAKHITLQALESGAIDYIQKPKIKENYTLDAMAYEVIEKLKIVSKINISQILIKYSDVPYDKEIENYLERLRYSNKKLITIGASMGGVDAIRKIVTKLPAEMPCILVVQHMPSLFTKTFADRLNELSQMRIKEAAEGDIIEPGKILIAPGDFHTVLRAYGNGFRVVCEQSEKLYGSRPSIDITMFSISENIGPDAVGVILTGEGKDGVNGIMAMKRTGAVTIAQNEESSIINEIVKKAQHMGAFDKIVDLNSIPLELVKIAAG